MNDVVILCESYPQVKNALYIIAHNCDSHPITVVTIGNHDLLRFFEAINERVFHNTINITYFEVYQGRMAKAGNKIEKALYLLPDILRERRYLRGIFDKYFAQLRGAEIYFFNRCFNASAFYLLKRLDSTNRLVYMPDPIYDVVSVPEVVPANIIELMYLARCKLVYGHDIAMGKHPLGQIVTRMPDKFFRENVARVISREERDSMLKDFDLSRFQVFDSGDHVITYFHEDLVEGGYVADSAAFEIMLGEVLDILGKHFPGNEVAHKYHPGSGPGKTAIRFGDVLPDFIPGELLYNEKVEMYLGYTSRVLANVEKGLVVSLIDLVNFKSDRIREGFREILIQSSHSKVLFPKSLDEFERILDGIIKAHNMGEP